MKIITTCFLILFLPAICSTLWAQQTELQYLSGRDKDQRVDWEFYIDKGMNSGQWTTIPVPSNWETEGFGVFNYGRGEQPESDETGQYRHRFSAPANWKNRQVNVVFEGVMTDATVFINGKQAGETHQGSFYRFKYDVSKLLRYGRENLLEVTVKNWSANESVNKAERAADFWIFGGIYRPVYLEALPKSHIAHAALDAKADGSFALHAELVQAAQGDRIEAQLLTQDGAPFGQAFETSVVKDQSRALLQSDFSALSPQLWSPESPALYNVRVRLLRGSQVMHEAVERFGFRTVELRPREGFYVNGEKIIFKGVNRHSAWPTSGRTTSYALSLQDVLLMKDMNMNAVRMSHYPPDKHFLEVCDSLGLFVINELTGWQDAYDTQVGRKLVKALIRRDVNHPSVVIWANGNEGGNNHDLVSDYHVYDPQKRPIIHPWEKFRDTDTDHYRPFGCCVDGLEYGDEVYFPTEILHGIYDGGHGAGLDDRWHLMQQSDLGAGMFLWVFADEGIVRNDMDGVMDTNGSNAPDGIVGPYREKEGSYFTIKEIWSPVQIRKTHITPRFDGRLKVWNHYHFTDLSACTFTWELCNFPTQKAPVQERIVAKTGSFAGPEVAPGHVGWLELPLPNNWRDYQALYLSITDPHGQTLWTHSWPLFTPEQQARALEESQSTSALPAATAQQTAGRVNFQAQGVAAVFSTENGQLLSVQVDGKPISFRGGPLLDSLYGNWEVKAVNVYQDGLSQVLSVSYEGIVQRHEWRMMPNGQLKLDFRYLPKDGEYDYVGLHFRYPEEKVKGVKFLGDGPYRVWKNRMKGTRFGVWEKAYNNTVTGESGWEYPEFKGYHSGLYWAVIDTEEGPIGITAGSEDLYLRLFTPDPPKGAYNRYTDGVFPQGDISFMHAISPIGTKFLPPSRLGPQGQPNMVVSRRNSRLPLVTVLYFDFKP